MKSKFFAKLLNDGNDAKKEISDSKQRMSGGSASLVRGGRGVGGRGGGRGVGGRGGGQFKTAENDSVYTRDLNFEDLKLKGIQIMFMSEEEIERLSEVNVRHDGEEEKAGNLSGTISDPRMYPATKNVVCSTCLLPQNICAGHLGRIELVRPIINYWAYKHVISVLESICHECGSLLLELETVKRYPRGSDRLKKIANDSKGMPCRNKQCDRYESPNFNIIKKVDTMVKVQLDSTENAKMSISSSKIVHLFKNLTVDELEALGFPQNTPYSIHPKNMLFTYLPVLPENHRPDGFLDNEPKPDNLTSTYRRIVTANNSLKNRSKQDKLDMDYLENQVCSIHHRDNDAPKSGNPLSIDTSKNITELISKKEGLIRSNAMSKRCDHTSRTVLGPADPNTRFGYIRLPKFMSNISLDERICDQNIDYYNNMLEEGKIGQVIDARFGKISFKRRNDITLQNGMIIKRPLQDGDPIIFNRNPTLYKHSMMGYIARMGDGLNIGFHSSNTSPHNADFDGDEGNIHVCPKYLARAEILFLSGCWNNIVSAQFSRPTMGLVYNATASAYLLSAHEKFDDDSWDSIVLSTFGDKRDRIDQTKPFDSLMVRAKRQRPKEKHQKSGAVLISALFPQDFYYKHDGVEIKEGILVSGRLAKSHVEPSKRSIVHILFLQYGTMVATRFLSEGHALFDTFIETLGFTMGYRDCSMPNAEKEVKNILENEMKIASEKLLNIAPLRSSEYPEVQKFYIKASQAALDFIKPMGKEIIEQALTKTNSLKIMVDSGSKGKYADVAMLIGVVGQQFLREGKRPPLVFNRNELGEGERFLPIYDITQPGNPEKITSRGFVDRPLGKGMRPGQFVAHMMASRLGLIDTASGTKLTGYSSHILSKALEDVRYNYNGTIGGDFGNVIQYAGGEDSFEPMHMTPVKDSGFGSIWMPADIRGLVDKLNEE